MRNAQRSITKAQCPIRLGFAGFVFLLISVLAPPALAQGAYVGAFLVGDIVRLDQYDAGAGDSGNGESFGFALRLGAPLAAKWGVELEFVRPGEITSDRTPEILPLLTTTPPPVRPSLPNLPNIDVTFTDYDLLSFPTYSYTFRTTQRRTTLATSLWARQEISTRFSLVYLGGVAFGRTNNEIEIGYVPIRPTILPIPPLSTESITYDVQPIVGVEGRIRMGGKVDLVPGLRLQGAQGGWLIRPAIGLDWNF
jgi:hypothetical protein